MKEVPFTPGVYGLLAEFDTPGEVVTAAERAYAAGYRDMDGYSPFPIEELSEAIGFHTTYVPQVVLLGGLVGGLAGYGLEYWVSVIAYPLMVGGKPYHSWPAFIPVTFETTVLFAGISAVLGMILLNGLPRPYHPVFNAPRFQLASRDRFFLLIESKDPQFDLTRTRDFLSGLKPRSLTEVPY